MNIWRRRKGGSRADTGQRLPDAERASPEIGLATAADHDLAGAPLEQVETHEEPADSVRYRQGFQGHETHGELERIRVDVQRTETAAVRDDVATERDRAGDLRDSAARRADAALLASDPGNRALRAVVAANTELRDHAVADRRRAAADRKRAAEDRLCAAASQRQARIDVQRAQLDGQTGVYARELGHTTLRSEIDRCRRHADPFVLALIRVDAVTAIHDRRSGPECDAVAESVVVVLRDKLRSYDPVVRVASNEFMCGLPGSEEHRAQQRVEEIRTAIECAHPLAPPTITVALATLAPHDTLGSLIDRASADLPAT